MSKKAVKKQTQKDAKSAPSAKHLTQVIDQIVTLDAYQNMAARLGYGTPNLAEGTEYPLTRLTRDYNLMNSLYRNNWLATKVVNIIPKDMVKNKYKFTSDITPEDIKKITQAERIARVWPSILEGLCWGRLYGGAAALMMIEGQEEDLSQPLDIDSILPGDFKGLLVVDRWSGIYPDMELVEDPSNPEYGLPKFYQFRNIVSNENFRVHHSRVIRFVGHYLPWWERQAEVYWGASIIEPLFEELKKRDNTSANIAALVFQAKVTVLKIKDLDALITGNNASSVQDFYNTMQAQNWLMSNQGRQLIGAEDDFQSIQYAFAGLNDIYESFMLDMSGACGIPVTKLFGRSPAGMNSTGEHDMQNYYDTVEQEQEAHLRPVIEKLLPILCMSALGYVPDDLEFMFNPIGTPTDKEIADIVKAKSDSICDAYERLGIPQQVAFQELKQLSDGTSMFTNLTDDIINKASQEIEGPLNLNNQFGDPEFNINETDVDNKGVE